MSYQEFSEYIDSEIDLLATQSFTDVAPELDMPQDQAQRLTALVQEKFDARCREHFSRSNRDALLRRITDSQASSKLRQLQTVMDTVGDFQRQEIGPDIREIADGQDGTRAMFSLDRLVHALRDLPKVTLVDATDVPGSSLVREYDSLHSTLCEKIQALALARRYHGEMEAQRTQLEALVEAIRATRSESVQEYCRDYDACVADQLRHTCELVETLVKRDGSIPPDLLAELKTLVASLPAAQE
ncbi:LAMI_0E14422g1_1 [Lachancea mirantina]|uniref:LAMI_0E14422g1_1 n=1 Tax=Lachancea mirantina TaxID=1230905 RepID=A0A1G4JRL0_9SACH|nr:LAMI_0E14422g1_1 [Lachancea mirantina]